MHISEFARTTGLSTDTVRFYMKKGLLRPERGEKGASSSYHTFDAEDVTAARMIRLQQSLGFSLAEISALNEEYRKGERSTTKTTKIMQTQIARLQAKRDQADAALRFLRAKLKWLEAGKRGGGPDIGKYNC
jgi:MerR family copper efflux transcriptional regulator